MKKIIVASLAAATFFGAAFSETQAGYRGRYYGHHYHHHGYGDAVAAGVVGLAAGAMIAGAMASQPPVPPPPATMSPSLAAYCARKYRSFDPVTGTYLARTGERIVCTY